MNLALKYPPFDVRVKNNNGVTYIFDNIRKKWFILTPEEWVRQHMVNFLTSVKQFPASIIAIEKEIALNDTTKRFDIVVYNKLMKPSLIIECKAPYIELDDTVIAQVQRYNLILKAPFMMITNGMSDLVLDINNQICDLPEYNQL